MAFTSREILGAMLRAARQSLGRDWGQVRDFATPELKRLAQVLKDISVLATRGKVSQREAKSLLRIHRNTTLTVLLTAKGLGLLAAERAVNAALNAAADVVNAALPFRLL